VILGCRILAKNPIKLSFLTGKLGIPALLDLRFLTFPSLKKYEITYFCSNQNNYLDRTGWRDYLVAL